MKKQILLLLILSCALLQLQGRDFYLVKGGQAQAQIILSPTVALQESYAAHELAGYVKKLTGAALPVSFSPVKGLYEIHLTHDAEYSSRETAAARPKLKQDGFLIHASDRGLWITALNPIGVLYGVYDILKKYGGIRWLYPGEDGESYTARADLSIPEQLVWNNPSFVQRTFNLTGCAPGPKNIKTIQWQLRNGMTPSRGFMDNEISWGGHDFWTYLPPELFKDHPELFPMRHGKRHPTHWNMKNPGYTNPCVSNPETMRIICDNVISTLNKHRNVNTYRILQDDTPNWCECENCRKLDSPAERLTKSHSNRFWIYSNQVIDAIRKNFPEMQINVHAYMTSENPPDRVRPDIRISLLRLVTIRRCFTHSMGDASCPVNKKYRERISAWHRLGYKLMLSECTPMLPVGTQIYNPMERVLARDLQYYHSQGATGYCDERPPLVDNPKKRFIRSYYPVLANSWYYDAIPRYIQAAFLWNVKADFDEVMEDFGSRYYGDAWKYMKPYRELLRKCYENSGLHFAYGSPNIMAGQNIKNDADRKELRRLLEEARKTARHTPGILKRIERDLEGFQGLELRYREYAAKVRMTREIRFVNSTVPTEADWNRAQTVSDFEKSMNIPADFKTSAKLLYSRDRLFFRIHAAEPLPKKIISRKTMTDDKLWEDNEIEIFIAPPALNGRYLHLIFNAAGVKFDAMTLHATDSDIAFDSKAVIKTRILKDAWTADVSIPFTVLGGSPASEDLWPVNISRMRRVSDNGKEYLNKCSWSNGTFHGTAAFRNMKFVR